MTKLAVIHISDIHIHNKSDQCLRHVSKIASACFSLARDADACLLTITGDVAFSGSVAEYEAARDLLIRPLVDAIKLETARPVYISITHTTHTTHASHQPTGSAHERKQEPLFADHRGLRGRAGLPHRGVAPGSRVPRRQC